MKIPHTSMQISRDMLAALKKEGNPRIEPRTGEAISVRSPRGRGGTFFRSRHVVSHACAVSGRVLGGSSLAATIEKLP